MAAGELDHLFMDAGFCPGLGVVVGGDDQILQHLDLVESGEALLPQCRWLRGH